MKKLDLKNLCHSYQGQPTLDSISMQLKAGEIVTLLGESGAGKSTLLRCLNLLEMPHQGIYRIGDLTFDLSQSKNITKRNLQQLRQTVGMVFQQYFLWSHKTVLDNLIEAPMRVLKQSCQHATRQALELLDFVCLKHKANAFPAQLSGGQSQRVAIMRTLMMSPEVILFDEPTAALDPEQVSRLANLVKELADKGKAILIATHDMQFAAQVSHQSIYLQNGKIIENENREAA